jgi:hypothetical protein
MNPEDMTIGVLFFPDVAIFDGDLRLAITTLAGLNAH